MRSEGVGVSEEESTGTFLIESIFPHIRHEQVEQSIVIEVKEYGPTAMADIIDSGIFGYVQKLYTDFVSEKPVSVSDGRNKQIRVAVVVYIAEGCSDGNLIIHTDTG